MVRFALQYKCLGAQLCVILVWHVGAFEVLSHSGFLVACSVVTAFSAEFKIILVLGRELSLKIDGLAFFL